MTTSPVTISTSRPAEPTGGCGCGGCGCGSSASESGPTADVAAPRSPAASEATGPATTAYAVEGMTCGHCVAAVTEELSALPGVTDVTVDLVNGGVSTVTVAGAAPLEREAVRAAVDEAGYTLVDRA